MIGHKLLPLFALGLNLLLLGSALTAGRRSPRVRSFVGLVSALAVWNFGVFGLRWTDDRTAALVWERVVHVGVIPIPVLFYHYVFAFLGTPARGILLVIGYVLCGLFLAASPTPAFMHDVSETAWGFAPVAGPLYAPFVLFFYSYLGIGLGWLVRVHRTSASSFRKNRTLVVIIGAAVSVLGGLIDFLRFILGWDRLYPVGIPSNAIFAVALGIAIVRYRLMDLGVVAKRFLLYLLTSLALAPVVFVGLSLMDALTPRPVAIAPRLGSDLLVPVIVLVALAAALPLLRKLEAGLERVMFERQHGVRDALVALSKEISSMLDIGQLGPALTGGLVSRIPAVHAALYIWDPPSQTFDRVARTSSGVEDAGGQLVALDSRLALWLRVTGKTLVVEEITFEAIAERSLGEAVRELERAQVALLVPLFLEGELTAILVLGEKLSGEMFDPGEIELLETLMGHSAIALKNSRLYADLRAEMEELGRTQQQLIQSAKLAAIGELAATVAHELNNPLMVILGMTQLLREATAADAPGQRKLVMIEEEAMRASRITRSLLDFARRREPRFEPIALSEVIERSLEVLHPKLGRGRVRLETLFDPAVPRIQGDPDQLVQVFVNLVANAIDAMPKGGRLVLQTAVEQHDGTPCAVVRVSDTGVGIAREEIAQIFEPFYTTKPEGQGTGLGLSVSQHIINRHAGTIDVESEPGQGTTMLVKIPIGARGDTPAPPATNGHPAFPSLDTLGLHAALMR